MKKKRDGAAEDATPSRFSDGCQCGKVVMNGGESGGMINAETLKAQLDKMTKRVDTIIDALNNCGANTYGGPYGQASRPASPR